MKLSITNKNEITSGLWEVGFDIDGKNFSFIAGQYVRVVLPRLEFEDTKGPARLFSIASSPNDKRLIILFRSSESGFKKTITNMPVGAELEIEGPWGSIFLPENSTEPVTLIAGGMGIAPFLSILRSIIGSKLSRQITLLYAARNNQNLIYIDELQELAKNNANFKLVTKIGPIDDDFIKNDSVNISHPFYVSGPAEMVDATVSILLKLGAQRNKINFEEWSEVFFRPILGEILFATPDGVCITDLNGFIRYVNPSWENMTGWKKEEVINKVTPRILKSGKMSADLASKIWRSALNGATIREEIIDKKKDGAFYDTDEVFIPLKNWAGGIFGHVAFQRDITDRKKMERDLKELSQNLEARVNEKTQELAQRVDDLERLNKLMVGRELKIADLKERIEYFEEQAKDKGIK